MLVIFIVFFVDDDMVILLRYFFGKQFWYAIKGSCNARNFKTIKTVFTFFYESYIMGIRVLEK